MSLRREPLEVDSLWLWMMAYSEDHIALAAEYALGTLDADERAQVETMMAVDKDFTAVVQAWEFRLGVLNQMVGAVEPRPNCGSASGRRSGMPSRRRRSCCRKRRRLRAAEAALGEPVARLSAADRRRFQRHPPAAQARRWRNVASAMTALAAALVAMLAVAGLSAGSAAGRACVRSRGPRWSR